MEWAGIIGGLITVAGFFGITKWQEKKRERDEKLRIHFEDIKHIVDVGIGPITRTLNIHKGRLILKDYVPVAECYNFKKDESYISFQVHFPELASEWKQLEKEVLKLDSKFAKLYLNIAQEFQLQGLNIITTDTNPKHILKACIYDYFFEALFEYWKELRNHNQSTIFDSIETQSNTRWGDLYASGQKGSPVAHEKETKDRERCKSAIYNLLENGLIKQEGFNLIGSVEKLREKRINFARKLDNKMRDTKKYGIGKEFKKLGNCPICKKF